MYIKKDIITLHLSSHCVNVNEGYIPQYIEFFTLRQFTSLIEPLVFISSKTRDKLPDCHVWQSTRAKPRRALTWSHEISKATTYLSLWPISWPISTIYVYKRTIVTTLCRMDKINQKFWLVTQIGIPLLVICSTLTQVILKGLSPLVKPGLILSNLCLNICLVPHCT